MTTPKWMPPLPRIRPKGDRYSRDEMERYALAAVEAYRLSRVPVAWLRRHPPEGGWAVQVQKVNCPECEKFPLYRLDGGDDE